MFTTVPVNIAGLDIPVSSLMRAGCITVPGEAPLALAARAMADHGVHAVLVVQDGRELGWVTSRGLLHNRPREWEGATAADAVTEPVARVDATATVAQAVAALLAASGSHVVVSETPNGGSIGVVSESDLVSLLAASD